MQDSFRNTLQLWKHQPSEECSTHLTHLLYLIGILVSWRKGSRIVQGERVCAVSVISLWKTSKVMMTHGIYLALVHRRDFGGEIAPSIAAVSHPPLGGFIAPCSTSPQALWPPGGWTSAGGVPPIRSSRPRARVLLGTDNVAAWHSEFWVFLTNS